MRLDLTQNRLYTLSPGTKQVLAELKEPINLYFYFSRDAAAKQSPLLMPYATRVREFLEEIAARSGGKIRLQRDRSAAVLGGRGPRDRGGPAIAAGRRGAAKPLYFGLAGTNSTDGRSVIPSFQPDREEFLEYDVAKLVQELATPKKPVIGLMSSLPDAGPVQSDDRPDGRYLADPLADRAALHGAHADHRRRSHRQGRRRADGGASEAAAARRRSTPSISSSCAAEECCCSSIRTAAPTPAGRIRRIRSPARWPIIPRTWSRCSRHGASTTIRPR